MTEARVHRVSLWIPLICSAIAFAIVMANIIARMPPQPDENASAHLWQLLMALQLPFIALFAVTSDWRHWRRPAALIGAQLAAFAAAAAPVWLAGY